VADAAPDLRHILRDAAEIFGAASAYRSARQPGHSLQVAEKHCLGLVRGIPRDARTLEAAMQIEDVMAKLIVGASGRRRVVRSSEPQDARGVHA
jgi:hypothetical protein